MTAPNGGSCPSKFFSLQNGLVQTMLGIPAGELYLMMLDFCALKFYKVEGFSFDSSRIMFSNTILGVHALHQRR